MLKLAMAMEGTMSEYGTWILGISTKEPSRAAEEVAALVYIKSVSMSM